MGESAYRATWTRILSDWLQTGSSAQKTNFVCHNQFDTSIKQGTVFKMKADAYQGVGDVCHRTESIRT